MRSLQRFVGRPSSALMHMNRIHARNSLHCGAPLTHLTRHLTIGIDLGTTTSTGACMIDGKPTIIPNSEGDRITPSVVGFCKPKNADQCERLVGKPAKRQAVTNPKATFDGMKRYIGMQFDDPVVQKLMENSPFELVRAPNGDVWARCPVSGKDYSPSQIGAFILEKIKNAAEDYLGQPVTDAVITVPAYFNDSQRTATKNAGEIAGLNVKRVISEPTAAALSYGLNSKDRNLKNVAVYDLGGGTFDVSILTMNEGVFEVLATSGDSQLGGHDFDGKLLNYVADDFLKHNQIDLREDPFAVQRLKEAVETAKKELDSKFSTTINAPFITNDASGPKNLDMEITRATLNELCDDLVERTLAPMEDCIREAELKKSEIDEVVLVGGQTRMPKVQEFVEKFFGRKPSKQAHPDEAVALGAAVQAGIIDGNNDSRMIVIDVTPLSLGIQTLGDVFTALIPKNTHIPTQKTETFSTAADNQTQVRIDVYQGERAMASDNKHLGSFELVNIPPSPRGKPQIDVTFDLDANSILTVSAKDKATGKDNSMNVNPKGGLSADDIKRMQEDAKRFADVDEEKKQRVELMNTADTSVWNAQKQVEEQGSKIDGNLKNEIEEKVNNVKMAREGDDMKELKRLVDELSNAMMKIGESVYGQAKSNDQSASSSDFHSSA